MNNQNIDPFNPAAPLDVDEITDHLQHYWQLYKYFKNETQTQLSNNRNRNNKRDRDNGNQKSSQTAQNDSKKAKKDKGNKDASSATNHTNSNCGGRDSNRGRCPTAGLPIRWTVRRLWNAVITRLDFKFEAIF